MKISYAISLLTTLVFCSISSNSFAQEIKTLKTLDGSVVYCDKDAEQSTFGSKQIYVQVVGANKTDKSHEPSLKISVVKCQNSKWVVDSKPSAESYIAPNGAKVAVRYSEYEVLILSNDEKVLAQMPLNELASAGVQTLTTSMDKSKDSTQSFEVLVRANRTIKSSDGYNSTDLVTFGTFRIQFKNQ
ncbi:MAG: hypothetical protein ACXVCR_17410 [Bdellovibrio sp.]